jgi:hypothetical protein
LLDLVQEADSAWRSAARKPPVREVTQALAREGLKVVLADRAAAEWLQFGILEWTSGDKQTQVRVLLPGPGCELAD